MKRFLSKYSVNILLFALLLILVLVPDAKAMVLNGLLKMGLFSPEHTVKNERLQISSDVIFTGEDGKTISLSSLQGKVVFINFWATWCPPCRAEMPSINALIRQFSKEEDMVFITVDADGNLSRARKFLEKKKYTIPVYVPAGDIPSSFFSGKLPTTVVLDKNGNIVFRHEGLANYNDEKFHAALRKLLLE